MGIPGSGYLLCYIPLFLVIGGFIAAAMLTDADARRTYLRRRDTRAEGDGHSRYSVVPITQKVIAQTPSGMRITMLPEEATATASAPAAAAMPIAEAPAPIVEEVEPATIEETVVEDSTAVVEEDVEETEVAAAPSEPDNLRKIEGIGPKMNSVLNAAGITTFAQLAAASVEKLTDILNEAGVSLGVNPPDTWPEQAALAAEGDWDALEKLQDELDGGRRKS